MAKQIDTQLNTGAGAHLAGDAATAGAKTHSGIIDWLTMVNHKTIGLSYIATALIFFLLAGLMALAMRLQLAQPNNTLLSNDAYNQAFTMHGTTMIFLVAMPLSTGLANYLVPLQIGARDMAFPKLNALSYWLLLFGGLFLYSSFFLGGAPASGWFSYAPLTEKPFSASHGMDFWALTILIVSVSTTVGSINLLVTVNQLRAPGMTATRIPLFPWMVVVTSVLSVFAFPSVAVAAGLLLLDRNVGTHFFNVAEGGQRPPLAASLLVLWPPGSLYFDLACLWHRLRGDSRLFGQAAV